MPRKSAFGRLLDHFQTHPQGRLHELLFWLGLGTAFMGFAIGAWRAGWVSDPIAWLIGIVGLCMFLFGLLPQRKPKTRAAPLPGRLRAERLKAARESKEEGKRARAAKRGGR